MAKPKTLNEKAQKRLRTLTDEAITVIRRENISAFTKGWLGQELGITKPMASAVISQLKKEHFLRDQTANFGDFQDPRNRGKYSLVRRSNGSVYAVGTRWVNGKGRYSP